MEGPPPSILMLILCFLNEAFGRGEIDEVLQASLCAAVKASHQQMVQLLLRRKADVNAQEQGEVLRVD